MKRIFCAVAVMAVTFVSVLLVGGCSDDNDDNPGGSHFANGSQFNPNIDYGTLTDPRDGKTYRTVTIGTQTWMAENLNYDPGTGNSWCYGNNTSNCDTYGRLYDWAAAMEICPNGWHLPHSAEWDVLMSAVDDSPMAGTRLKSAIGWIPISGVPTGTDDYGFSALPGGLRLSDGSFGDAGNIGLWWTAAAIDASSAWYRSMSYFIEDVGSFWYYKTYGFSVRCLMD